MTERSVKDLWWEGQDLHIIYKDNNEHVVYKNCYIQDITTPDDQLLVTKIVDVTLPEVPRTKTGLKSS